MRFAVYQYRIRFRNPCSMRADYFARAMSLVFDDRRDWNWHTHIGEHFLRSFFMRFTPINHDRLGQLPLQVREAPT